MCNRKAFVPRPLIKHLRGLLREPWDRKVVIIESKMRINHALRYALARQAYIQDIQYTFEGVYRYVSLPLGCQSNSQYAFVRKCQTPIHSPRQSICHGCSQVHGNIVIHLRKLNSLMASLEICRMWTWRAANTISLSQTHLSKVRNLEAI